MNDSGSWNKYSYTRGDPVNRGDRRGRADCEVEEECPDLEDGGGDPGTVDCSLPQNQGNPACKGSGGGNVDQNSLNLKAAVGNAIAALKANPDCLSDFGTGVTRANGFNPIDVLSQISTNGKIVFAPLGPTVTAVTIPIITTLFGSQTPGLSIQFGALIIINSSSNPGSTAFSGGDLFNNTLTLLHELGHYYDYTSGSGGSALQTPDSVSGNAANDARIIKDWSCRVF